MTVVAIYQRHSGGHVAERVQPVPGSEEAERYAALADDPASDWRRIEPDTEREPVEQPLPVKSASKADWKAYAVSQGIDEEAADKATRDELAAKYADGGDS